MRIRGFGTSRVSHARGCSTCFRSSGTSAPASSSRRPARARRRCSRSSRPPPTAPLPTTAQSSRDADARGLPRRPRACRSRASSPASRAAGRRSTRRPSRSSAALTERALLLVDDFHLLEQTAGRGGPRAAARAHAAAARRRSSPPVRGRASTGRACWSPARCSRSARDDLRFRSWEVERLFLGVYGEPLPLGGARRARAAHRGLGGRPQALPPRHAGRPAAERRRVLRSLGRRWSHAREYLAATSWTTSSPELRDFLVETCVLTTLSGRLCDALLGRNSLGPPARASSRRGSSSPTSSTTARYRYHEVLRSQLEAMLVERLGEVEAREPLPPRRRAARGRRRSLPDALYAYCRAEAWDEVERLLGRDGHRIVDGRPVWLDVLPRGAPARRPVAAARGRAPAAGARPLRRRDRDLPSRRALLRRSRPRSRSARRERIALAAWIEPSIRRRPTMPLGLLRAATIRDPRRARRQAARLGTPEARAVSGPRGPARGALPRRRRAARRRHGTSPTSPGRSPRRRSSASRSRTCSRATPAARPRRGSRPNRRSAPASPGSRASRHAPLALADPARGRARRRPRLRVTSEVERHAWGVHLSSLFEGWARSTAARRPSSCSRRRRTASKTSAPACSRPGRAARTRSRSSGRATRTRATRRSRRSGSRRRSGVVAARALAYLALAELDRDPASEYRVARPGAARGVRPARPARARRGAGARACGRRVRAALRRPLSRRPTARPARPRVRTSAPSSRARAACSGCSRCTRAGRCTGKC